MSLFDELISQHSHQQSLNDLLSLTELNPGCKTFHPWTNSPKLSLQKTPLGLPPLVFATPEHGEKEVSGVAKTERGKVNGSCRTGGISSGDTARENCPADQPFRLSACCERATEKQWLLTMDLQRPIFQRAVQVSKAKCQMWVNIDQMHSLTNLYQSGYRLVRERKNMYIYTNAYLCRA